ncbi:MAG: hypothetical protein OEY64_09960 [Nitrospinota bacterium]|nr:hypothetical protein [Nitrospinota bacterium]
MRILLASLLLLGVIADVSLSANGDITRIESKVANVGLDRVGVDFVEINERKILVIPDTVIIGTRGTAVPFSSLMAGMRVELIYYFNDEYAPVAKSIKVLSRY